ncbi:MAG TPA: response regulator transcription factor [Spirochaetia bacterium]|nr:response regulator transcription factor [Spirochaetia bacterium]
MIRLLLVDDQILFVESLRKLIEIEASDMRVVDIAHNGDEAVRKAVELEPDIVLMDVRMPDLDGVGATRKLRALSNVHIIMLTTFDDDDYVFNALEIGANGYLLKDTAPNELVAAIRAVHEGGVTISPAVARKLALGRGTEGREALSPAHDMVESLSRRERDVLRLIGEGCDNPEISQRLFLSEQTVRNYVSLLYSKLGVEKRSQAIRLSRDAGLARP